MNLFAIISDLRFQDILDILFLTFVAYYLFAWFQGTKAFKALVGLLVLGIVFTIAKTWGLFLTTWVFQFLWQILVILIVVLFQSEIRQVLEREDPIFSPSPMAHQDSHLLYGQFYMADSGGTAEF